MSVRAPTTRTTRMRSRTSRPYRYSRRRPGRSSHRSIRPIREIPDGPGATATCVLRLQRRFPNGKHPRVGDFLWNRRGVTAVFANGRYDRRTTTSCRKASARPPDWIGRPADSTLLPRPDLYLRPRPGIRPLTSASVAAAVYDREEGAALATDRERFSLPYGVNVISFSRRNRPARPRGVFGSLLGPRISRRPQGSGTMRLDAGRASSIAGTGILLSADGIRGPVGNLFGYATVVWVHGVQHRQRQCAARQAGPITGPRFGVGPRHERGPPCSSSSAVVRAVHPVCARKRSARAPCSADSCATTGDRAPIARTIAA